MHNLIVKMSSMGDVIHTLPALTDVVTKIPHCSFDWVVEPAFADIPAWHPAVKNVIPLPLRQWRKNWRNAFQSQDVQKFYKKLSHTQYDVIIDAQGLLKSAIVTRLAKGTSHGFDKHSAREWISSYAYQHKHAVSKQQHAIARIRELFAKTFNYSLPDTNPDYFIKPSQLPSIALDLPRKYLVFLHGTTWKSKHYPNIYWKQLIQKAESAGISVYLPWGNDIEKKRAQLLVAQHKNSYVLPKLTIAEIAFVLKQAAAAVSVDTGLGHLCAALGTPTISLYGPTNAKHAGTLGQHQVHLTAHFNCAPCLSRQCFYAKKNVSEITPTCFTTINPDTVWNKLLEIMHA